MLGWDAPAGPVPAPAATSVLVSALAPHAALTLLLPHLDAPMHLPAPATATGLSNFTAEELALADVRFSVVHPETWQSPTAPYLGASPEQLAVLAVPAAPYVGATPLPDQSSATAESAATTHHDPAADTLLNPDAFAADDAEPDTQEAGALDTQPTTAPIAPTVPAAVPVASTTVSQQPAPASSAPPATGPQSVLSVALASLRTEPTDEAGLNFRVIQYARFATRLAASQEFAVIYASDWQSWLAGMEIRQLTGKPLVLHVHSLAQDRNTAADRGWVMELERLALRRADLVLAASSAVAMRVLELHELPPQRVRRLSSSAAQDPNRLAEIILAALREVIPE